MGTSSSEVQNAKLHAQTNQKCFKIHELPRGILIYTKDSSKYMFYIAPLFLVVVFFVSLLLNFFPHLGHVEYELILCLRHLLDM